LIYMPRPVSKQTQKERAERAARDLDLGALRAVLDEAQNPPPDGAADGSLGDLQWNALNSIWTQASGLAVTFAAAKKVGLKLD
jgi:hypothetical protein